MGLVDYSESEASGSEAETAPKPAPKPTQPPSKKPFQKVVDRSNPGRIVVNLPQLSGEGAKANADEPPAKRAKTGGSGLFSGFNSFLPAPKNANKPKPAVAASTSSTAASGGPPKPGVNLKTSAAPGFSRATEYGDEDDSETPAGGMKLPPPKAPAQPSIPEGQKAAEDVKLVGKPLMFKPLSVARNPNKKKKVVPGVPKVPAPAAQPPAATTAGANVGGVAEPAPAPAPKKMSLFSMHTEEQPDSTPARQDGAYEPMFAAQESNVDYGYATDSYAQYAQQATTGPSATTMSGSESLDSIANDMNLTAAQRRELFGRDGSNHMAKSVINFNMDKEYQHNEEVRAAGEQQAHNPVKAIAGGKHSLRQLVQNVQNQRDALEDSFAKGKTNRKDASSRYGW